MLPYGKQLKTTLPSKILNNICCPYNEMPMFSPIFGESPIC